MQAPFTVPTMRSESRVRRCVESACRLKAELQTDPPTLEPAYFPIQINCEYVRTYILPPLIAGVA